MRLLLYLTILIGVFLGFSFYISNVKDRLYVEGFNDGLLCRTILTHESCKLIINNDVF
jgi:hypothetical protein